ncbi:MAG: FliH/SctL family protein [Pseudomonadota bacterium]
MTAGRLVFRATRIARDEFLAVQDTAATAQRRADRIIAEARATAAAISDDLKRREAKIDSRIRDMTDAQLRTFIDEQSLTQSARSMASLLSEAQRIRAAFEDLQPWLITLVETCLRKIVGQIDTDVLISATVAEAVSDMQAAHGLTLRVASGDLSRLLSISRKWPDAFASVENILADASLPPGEMTLESDGGLIAFGVESSMRAVIDNLEMALCDLDQMPGGAA